MGLLLVDSWLLEWHPQRVRSKVMDIVVGDSGCCGRDEVYLFSSGSGNRKPFPHFLKSVDTF